MNILPLQLYVTGGFLLLFLNYNCKEPHHLKKAEIYLDKIRNWKRKNYYRCKNIMTEMKKIPYQIEIDIYQVPIRFCRYYQETIYDYNDSGLARFEWDRIRQDYLLGKDYSIEEICNGCPLNLLLGVEGCRGDLFDFDIFIRMLQNVKPDSILLTRELTDSTFNIEETRQLIKEMDSLQEYGNNISWPVAQVFLDGKPVTSPDSLKFDNLVYHEWTGDEDQIYFTHNQGYYVGVTNQGILLKKNFGESFPEPFTTLTRKGMRAIGQTISGKTKPIPINRAVLPEWWPDNPTANSELRFTNLPVSNLFWDIFNMLIAFSETAVKNVTGINLFSPFYRRL